MTRYCQYNTVAIMAFADPSSRKESESKTLVNRIGKRQRVQLINMGSLKNYCTYLDHKELFTPSSISIETGMTSLATTGIRDFYEVYQSEKKTKKSRGLRSAHHPLSVKSPCCFPYLILQSTQNYNELEKRRRAGRSRLILS